MKNDGDLHCAGLSDNCKQLHSLHSTRHRTSTLQDPRKNPRQALQGRDVKKSLPGLYSSLLNVLACQLANLLPIVLQQQ